MISTYNNLAYSIFKEKYKCVYTVVSSIFLCHIIFLNNNNANTINSGNMMKIDSSFLILF